MSTIEFWQLKLNYQKLRSQITLSNSQVFSKRSCQKTVCRRDQERSLLQESQRSTMDYRSFSPQGLNNLAQVQMFEIIGSLTFDLHLW